MGAIAAEFWASRLEGQSRPAGRMMPAGGVGDRIRINRHRSIALAISSYGPSGGPRRARHRHARRPDPWTGCYSTIDRVIGWPATRIFTKADDGLALPWHGTVFMNPPFGGRFGHVPWLIKFDQVSGPRRRRRDHALVHVKLVVASIHAARGGAAMAEG
jgi:hypothetical protein